MQPASPDSDESALEAALAAAYGEPPPPEPAGSPAGVDVPRERAGYRIEGEIARGGMGVILKAHDADLGRDVALKVLRDDLARHPEVTRRFVEEARISGRLQHPGIVPVYEIGVMRDRRPYFAMKLVEGRTLAARLRESTAEERHALLRVFEAVCQTMAYAHARRIVHRDLKPSNVLIGEFGEVQVVDWGLSKVLDGTGTGESAAAGGILGTPAYMPPEQARGEIDRLDERSDVFSLGAILCEILTGEPPYTGEGERTLAQAASARLEHAARRLDESSADPELVSLCRACLAAEPGARPRSAAVLAERLHAYLVSVEDRARAAQIGAAAARVRARATLILSATGVGLLLLGGGAWIVAREQRAERVRTTETAVVAALQDATLARGREDWPAATAALERARARVDGGTAGEALRAQVRDLGASIEREADAARRAAALERDNAALLAALQDVREPEGDADYPTDWQAVDRKYAEVFASAGVRVDGVPPAEVARSLEARGIPVPLAAAFDGWTMARRGAGDDGGVQQLAEIADSLDPDPIRSDLRAAVARNDLPRLAELAASESAPSFAPPTLWLLGRALREGDRCEEAIALLGPARLRHPQEVALAYELGQAMRKIRPARAHDALAQFHAAIALRPAHLAAWHELGLTLSNDLGRVADTLAVFASAAERWPADGHVQFHVASALAVLGRYEEAVASYERSIQLDPDYVRSHCNLGVALATLGRYEEAVESYHRALEIDPDFANCHHNLGVSLRNLKRFDDALASFRRALELQPDASRTHYEIGFCLSRLRRWTEGIASLERAIELDPQFGPSYRFLGVCLLPVGREAEAIAAFRNAARLDPKDRYASRSVAWILTLARDEALLDPAEAVLHARRAVALAPEDPEDLEMLGMALYASGSFEEAREVIERAVDFGGADASRLMFLALCDERLGREERAREIYAEAEPGLAAIAESYPELARFLAEARERFQRD